jgi:hypothetical protein
MLRLNNTKCIAYSIATMVAELNKLLKLFSAINKENIRCPRISQPVYQWIAVKIQITYIALAVFEILPLQITIINKGINKCLANKPFSSMVVKQGVIQGKLAN